MKKQLKMAVIALGLLAVSTVNAQQESGTFTKIEDKGKSTEKNGTIRVIDNKGTKKYLQVKNGLTLLTDQTPAGGIVSTWQLGGTLTDDTYITATGKKFVIDGIKLIDPTVTGAGNAPAGTVVDASTTGATATTEAGYVFLVRDEGTGETKKLKASDVVKNGVTNVTATANQTSYDLTALTPSPSLTDAAKVWVYRNGAKLLAGVDYTVATTIVTLVPGTTAPNDWEVYAGDVIEIQFVY